MFITFITLPPAGKTWVENAYATCVWLLCSTIGICYSTLIDIFFTHKYCHVITSPIIPFESIWSDFNAVLIIFIVIGIITAPYMKIYRISVSASNEISLTFLIINTNPDCAYKRSAEILNIIDAFYCK